MGGRSTVVHGLDNPDIPLELGGSIFVKANQNLYSAAKNLGLELQEAGTARPGESTKALVGKALIYPLLPDVITIFRGYGMVKNSDM